MDDQRSERPHRGSLLELVGPAAVVGHGVAAEVVFSRRIVHQHHQDLARRGRHLRSRPSRYSGASHAVADEEQLVRTRPPRGPPAWSRPRSPRPASQSPPGSEEACHGDGGGAHEGYCLNPGPVRIAGLESQLSSNTPLRYATVFSSPGEAGRPPAELVGSQGGDVRQETVLGEARPGLAAAGEAAGLP